MVIETAEGTGPQCPTCGVRVSPGYVRCPKCQGVLSGAGSSRNRRSTLEPGGGTSVAEPDGPARWPWIAGGVAVLAVVVIALAVAGGAAGGGDERVEEEDSPPAITGGEGQRSPAPATGPATARPGAGGDDGESKRAAIGRLTSALKTARLWSSVTTDAGDPTVVTIRSGACEEEAMRPVVAQIAPELAAVGFAAVKCYERHGTLVFESPLGTGR